MLLTFHLSCCWTWEQLWCSCFLWVTSQQGPVPCCMLWQGSWLHPSPQAYCTYRSCTIELWCCADFQCYLTRRQVKAARSNVSTPMLFAEAEPSPQNRRRKLQYFQVFEATKALSLLHLKGTSSTTISNTWRIAWHKWWKWVKVDQPGIKI